MSTKKSKKTRAKPAPRTAPLMSSDERRTKALAIAVSMARKTGAGGVSVKSVAERMKVSAPLLFHIFGTSADFAKAVGKQAKKDGVTLPTTTVTVRMQAAIKSRAAAKLVKAPKPVKAAPRKRSIAEVKAIKDKLANPKPKLAALLLPPLKVRKPLTAAQKTAKAGKDAARRAAPVTPAAKFAALPTPMEASIASVS